MMNTARENKLETNGRMVKTNSIRSLFQENYPEILLENFILEFYPTKTDWLPAFAGLEYGNEISHPPHRSAVQYQQPGDRRRASSCGNKLQRDQD